MKAFAFLLALPLLAFGQPARRNINNTTSPAIVRTKWPSITFTATDSAPIVGLFNATGADPKLVEAIDTIPFPRTLLSTLANAGGAFEGLAGILRNSIDGQTREVAISDWLMLACRIGFKLDAQYVWNNNVLALELVGWNDTKINGLGASINDINAQALPYTPRERVILNLIEEQLDNHTNSHKTLDDALQILSVPELVEVLILCGTYTTFAGAARSLRVAQDSTLPGIEEVFKGLITSNYKDFNQG